MGNGDPVSGAPGRGRIGIVASHRLIERNMEHVAYRVAEILGADNELVFIGCEAVSARIAEDFPVFGPDERSWLRFIPVIGGKLSAVSALFRSGRDVDVFLSISAIGINGLGAAVAGRIYRRPAVVRLTSDVFNVFRAESGVVRKLRMFVRNNVLGRVSMRLADLTLALHPAQKDMLVASGLPEERVEVVCQPIVFGEQPKTDALRFAVRDRLGIPPDAYCVGYVGRLDPGKLPEFLAQMLEIIGEESPDTHVLVVGDGKSKGGLVARLSRYDRIRFIDQVERDALAGYYAAMDVLVHTSQSEGLSSVILEALHFNRPVVATDSGTITRGVVSNICASPRAMADMVLNRAYVEDKLPDYVEPEANAGNWRRIMGATIQASRVRP